MKRLALISLLLLYAAPLAAAEPAPAAAPAKGEEKKSDSAAAPAPPPVPPHLPVASKGGEEALAAAFKAGRIDGELVTLRADDREFLAIYKERIGPAKGAVLLLHDIGGNADVPEVISPLRRDLPLHGWSTLSVQLPFPDPQQRPAGYGPLLDAAAKRVEAGLAFLKERNQLNVVLVGHGLGATLALDHVARQPESIRGVALVGLPLFRGLDPRLDPLPALGQSTLPTLDLYGSRDSVEVVATAPSRREAAVRRTGAKVGGGGYLQMSVVGADHFFRDYESTLIKRIRGWIERCAPGEEVKVQGAAEKKQSLP